MKKNQKVVVSADAPFHANRIGYFQFISGKDTVVLTENPTKENNTGTYFAVAAKHADIA